MEMDFETIQPVPYTIHHIIGPDELYKSNIIKKNQKLLKILAKAAKKAKDNCLDFVKVDRACYSHEELKTMDLIMKKRGYGLWKNGKGWTLYNIGFNLKKII